jgi:hypothetical protein
MVLAGVLLLAYRQYVRHLVLPRLERDKGLLAFKPAKQRKRSTKGSAVELTAPTDPIHTDEAKGEEGGGRGGASWDNRERTAKNMLYKVKKGVALNDEIQQHKATQANPLTTGVTHNDMNEDPEAKEEDEGPVLPVLNNRKAPAIAQDSELWKHMDSKLFGGKIHSLYSKRGSARFWGKSLVSDFDMATDWIFLTEVQEHSLYYVVFASCIVATLLYLYQVSDGLFGLLEKNQKRKEEKTETAFGPIFYFTLLCIFLEDIVQLVLTLVVTGGNFDSKAQLNILGSIFSIIIKVGEAEFAAEAEWVHTYLRDIQADVAEFERQAEHEETAKKISKQEKKERPVLMELYDCLSGDRLAQSWTNWGTVLPIYNWSGVTINPDTGVVVSLNMRDQMKSITDSIMSTADSNPEGSISKVCKLPVTLKQCTAYEYHYKMDALLNGEQKELNVLGKSVHAQDHQFIACLLRFQENWAPMLTSLNLASCEIGDHGAKVIASALKLSPATTLSFLNISSNKFSDDGARHIAAAIPTMGAMSKLTFGDKQVVTMTIEMTEANFSGKLKSYEARIVAAFLLKCT